ncbi:MAG: TraR/DksA C4-type zinc finger protein [Candidatus Parcubacteria bacterium]|nr:TraR/DksA C4-type zinc finger protein [Candidatus Parcubacteria bacterium]
MAKEQAVCECGNEIPEARVKALKSIGGTNKCTECQAKEEAETKTARQLRPPVAAKALEQLGNAPY